MAGISELNYLDKKTVEFVELLRLTVHIKKVITITLT